MVDEILQTGKNHSDQSVQTSLWSSSYPLLIAVFHFRILLNLSAGNSSKRFRCLRRCAQEWKCRTHQGISPSSLCTGRSRSRLLHPSISPPASSRCPPSSELGRQGLLRKRWADQHNNQGRLPKSLSCLLSPWKGNTRSQINIELSVHWRSVTLHNIFYMFMEAFLARTRKQTMAVAPAMFILYSVYWPLSKKQLQINFEEGK